MKIKYLSASIIFSLNVGAAHAQSDEPANDTAAPAASETGQPIQVVFRNVKPQAGTIWISLCTEQELPNRDEGGCRGRAKIMAVEGAEYIFDDMPPGVYAVTAYHDEDDNGWLDFDTRGFPIEATGNSQNAVGSFGPPTFDQMKFTLPVADAGLDPYKIIIRLQRLSIP
ncbi:MAG: DUF2141 domain-containing protein [Pseudomonadota bacterium]